MQTNDPSNMKWLTGTLTAAAMMLLQGQGVASPLADNWNVEGAHGELHIHGTLTEAACRLDMVSAWQDITLGDTPLSDLEHPGDLGRPVTFTLRLRDCVRSGGNLQDPRTGGFSWDPVQPIVTVRFNALADAGTPQLVKANGVSGIGLRITDAQGKYVRLGESSVPQFVTPGGDELVYNVQPERTPAPLMPGDYRAVVNFALDYD